MSFLCPTKSYVGNVKKLGMLKVRIVTAHKGRIVAVPTTKGEDSDSTQGEDNGSTQGENKDSS